ncbi:ammonium transporter Mep1p [[Candida] anglica]|uniref:Ammonium transporter Mep1p n=1 Tax=[Candida] anglica TaxID=148631 RepID=A0ABP0EEB0_9ASCO
MSTLATSTYTVENVVDSLFMLYCTSLLPLVIIGIAVFYGGLTQRRSSLTMLGLPILLTPLVFIDWFIWSYSLSYASAKNAFIGSMEFVVLRHLRDTSNALYVTPRGTISSVNHFAFNGLMKAICVALTFPGCIAERGRIIPMLVFLFFWSCMIYNPVTYWFWNQSGWLSSQKDRLPVLDFAGGNCIHIVSGFTALAYSYILGPRNPKILYNYRNTNTAWVLLGTFLSLCGWVGFVTGCDYKFSDRSGYIAVNTVLCACVSGVIWTMIDYYFSAIPFEGEVIPEQQVIPDGNLAVTTTMSPTGVNLNQYSHSRPNTHPRRKISLISFSSGVMTGLVVITPSGGYISSSSEFWKAFLFGIVGTILTNLSTRVKYYMHVDDALDIFAIHGVAGIIGSIMTGIFATARYESEGGWVEGHWIQICYQLLGSVVTSVYVFVLSCAFLYLIDWIPFLHLRIDKDFNKRMREQKLLRERQEKGEVVEGAELDVEAQEQNHHTVNETEKWELLGTDNYEFNGEFLMDFMEFIKIISPDDYPVEDEYITGDSVVAGSRSGTSSDYQPYPEGYGLSERLHHNKTE